MSEYIRLLEKQINSEIQGILNLRKQLHSYPELGYNEYKTTSVLTDFLKKNGVTVNRFSDITGITALIDNNCSHTIGLRVDIDALPIEEKTGVDFCSQNNGIMHACGHDVHMTIGAGLSVILNKLKKELPVNVKVLFQPAEECNPKGGAKELIKRGVLDNPKLSSIIGFHVWPDYRVGEIAVRKGPIMASSDKFRVIIHGTKSHAAQPHKGVDAIGIGLNFINLIQNNMKKEIDPFEPYVISIGHIRSKGRYNIICDYVEIEGTIRTFNDEVRDRIHRRIEEILKGLTMAQGGTYELALERGYNAVINDKEISGKFMDYAASLIGTDNVKTDINPSLIGEDFGEFGKHIPSMYFHLGCQCPYPLHSDKFLPDEGCIEVALRLLGGFVLEGYSK